MANEKEPVLVFFGDIMLHLNEDQAQALLERKQIFKCDDTTTEHYHLSQSAAFRSMRGKPIDMRPMQEATVVGNSDVAELIDRSIKRGDRA